MSGQFRTLLMFSSSVVPFSMTICENYFSAAVHLKKKFLFLLFLFLCLHFLSLPFSRMVPTVIEQKGPHCYRTKGSASCDNKERVPVFSSLTTPACVCSFGFDINAVICTFHSRSSEVINVSISILNVYKINEASAACICVISISSPYFKILPRTHFHATIFSSKYNKIAKPRR